MISQHINILTLPYEFLGSGVFDENEPPYLANTLFIH